MRSLLMVFLAVGLLHCGPGSTGDAGVDAGPPTGLEMEQLFTQSCAVGTTSCHSATGARAGLDLSASAWYQALVGVASEQVPRLQRVVAGDPASSYLMNKLDGTMSSIAECMPDAGRTACGTQMPMVGGGALSESVRARVREWIRIGAPAPVR